MRPKTRWRQPGGSASASSTRLPSTGRGSQRSGSDVLSPAGRARSTRSRRRSGVCFDLDRRLRSSAARRRSSPSSTTAPTASAAPSPRASNGSCSIPSTSFLLHDPEEHMEEARLAVETVRELAPRVGVGTNVVQTGITFVERGDADVVLLAGRLTLLDRSAADELLPLCAERGVGLRRGRCFQQRGPGRRRDVRLSRWLRLPFSSGGGSSRRPAPATTSPLPLRRFSSRSGILP